ncbi:hypothetical protein ABTH99_17320 [Acinetobacter baumannii]
MSFFKKLKANMIINKKNEQTFYELAIREIATGQKRTGLWAIALSKSDGSLDKAHALYIGLLAEEIKNDIYLEEIKNEELRKNELVLAKEIEKLEEIRSRKQKIIEQEKLEEIRSRKQKIIEQEVHKEKKSNIPSIFEEMDKQKEKELQSKRQEEIDKQKEEMDKQKEEELKAQGIRIDPRFKSPQPVLKKY